MGDHRCIPLARRLHSSGALLYVVPQWPGHSHRQQAHVDVKVKDLDLAETEVLALGATSMAAGSKTFRVYLDPQRHPFCLVSW